MIHEVWGGGYRNGPYTVYTRFSWRPLYCASLVSGAEIFLKVDVEGAEVTLDRDRRNSGSVFVVLLLMEDILHHLGCMKPCKWWDKLPINWCRISSINSMYIWSIRSIDFIDSNNRLSPCSVIVTTRITNHFSRGFLQTFISHYWTLLLGRGITRYTW